MKSALLALFAAVFLTACASTGQPKKTPAELAARVCPPLEATIVVLQYSPAITPGAKEEIARGAPLVHAVCAPGALVDVTSLLDVADRTLPMLMQAVAESSLNDTDKQNTLLAIALIQVALNAAKYNVD